MSGRCWAVLVILVGLQLTGCSTIHFHRIDSETPIELAIQEGLLVMQIDTDLPIDRLALNGLTIIEPIKVGKHFWIARVYAREYSWKSVHISKHVSYAGRYSIARGKFPREGELDFEIKPGVLNYVGELIVRKHSIGYTRGFRRASWISIRIRNHAAMALRELERNYAELLDVYPLRTAGTSGDAFLEFYASERDRLTSESKTLETEDHP